MRSKKDEPRKIVLVILNAFHQRAGINIQQACNSALAFFENLEAKVLCSKFTANSTNSFQLASSPESLAPLANKKN